MISRHISIDEEYFERIKPYIDKHSGNLGAALREIINQIEIYDSHTRIDTSLSDWIFKEAEGKLAPDNIIDSIIDPNLITSMKKLDEYINNRFSKLEWNINVNLEADNDTLPSHITVDIRGSLPKINVVAGILSKYLIIHSREHSPLGIKSVVSTDESMRIEYCLMDKKKSLEGLHTYFGYTDEMLCTIKDRPTFWKSIIERHVMSDYNMVTIHKNHFEELLANGTPILGDITIGAMTKNAIQDIPLKELLCSIKNVYESSRIVDVIEIDGYDMVIHHSYRNQKTIDKLAQTLIALLENAGHLYGVKLTSSSIILKHNPDTCTKVDQIITNLKMSDSNVDQELARFIICINGLKDMPNASLFIKPLGRRLGISLMQEYEKEDKNDGHNGHNYNEDSSNSNDSNNGYDWSIEKFKKVIETIDLKCDRVSEWKTENGNTLYIVKECDIAKDGNKVNPYICYAIREMLKGALDYAFGHNAKLEVKKLMSHGDNSCEVILRTK